MRVIETRKLSKTYLDEDVPTVALKDISLTINEGEFVAIMGPSGSGKSTLLHILGFLDRATSGSFIFSGKTIDEYNENELAHIRNKKMGFIFQAFNLLARTSVSDNVRLPLLYSDINESHWNEMVKTSLEAVDLTHRLRHDSSQLSGGEKQRAAIARALVNNPDVIFADEPTGNLDSKSGEIIMNTIKKLNKEFNKTVILITHETYAAGYAERLIKLKDGEVEYDGPNESNHKKRGHYFK